MEHIFYNFGVKRLPTQERNGIGDVQYSITPRINRLVYLDFGNDSNAFIFLHKNYNV